VEQFYAPRYNALDWYMEALKRDPGDIRTNTAVGNYYLKNGDYPAARSYFVRAIDRLTGDYTRPVTCEPLYLQGLTLKAMGLFDEAVDTLYRATWDYAYHSAACFQLARISALRGDMDKALLQVEESLSTNTGNNLAVALKASLQRRKGDYNGAQETLRKIYMSDPLDFRIRNEYYLIAKELGDLRQAENILTALLKEMRSLDENYLQLAVGYIEDGLLAEAEDVLLRFPENHPLFDYYLGYIYHQQGENGKAAVHFMEASAQPVESVFPHRLKTVEVLKSALKYYPGDGNAWYYIGNILYEKQPEYAIESWKNAVKHNPELAVAYRNLGWGYYRHHENIPEAIPFYEKAVELDKKEAIYYTELDALYELNNTPVATRLKLFSGNNEVVKNRDDAFIRQIEVLTLAGQADKAVEYLDGKVFSYREGTSRVREIIIDAKLMLGRKYFEEGNFDKALQYFLEAQVQEEEAGSARLGNRHIQVNYYAGMAYEAMGNTASANEHFQKAAEIGSENVSGVMDYYQGLACLRLEENSRAKKIFEQMVAEAEMQLQDEAGSEVGVIFGEREAENIRKSRYYTLKGLGNKGLGKIQLAKKDLQEAVELSFGNLWAKVELDDM
jgi:tetratricopeptide (TPR) repeat protein